METSVVGMTEQKGFDGEGLNWLLRCLVHLSEQTRNHCCNELACPQCFILLWHNKFTSTWHNQKHFWSTSLIIPFVGKELAMSENEFGQCHFRKTVCPSLRPTSSDGWLGTNRHWTNACVERAYMHIVHDQNQNKFSFEPGEYSLFVTVPSKGNEVSSLQ